LLRRNRRIDFPELMGWQAFVGTGDARVSSDVLSPEPDKFL
jgi:hypothetical protein